MAAEITYLELSEAEGSSHKFYEVTVDGTDVTIRYGRIGDTGQTQFKTYSSPEKARADADKKIREKLRKGYEPAVQGVRQKRSITRRQVTSSTSSAKRSPTLWQFNSGSPAFGIFVDADHGWVGNQAGRVVKLNLHGEVLNQFQLPEGVKCIVADDVWIYAGCDDGNVYDLSGKVPRLAYEIDEHIDIFWLDIYDGILVVSDANGGVVKLDPEGEAQWTRLSQGKFGWMVRCDAAGIYHGHSHGVTFYDLKAGRQGWQQSTDGAVLFGWQEAEMIYAGTSAKKIHGFSKQGDPRAVYLCDASVYSCATTEGGSYVFAGDSSSSIYCFDQAGARLWKLSTGCGSALSMQFFLDRLYIVTTDGTLACIDVSKAAIRAAQTGELPQTVTIPAPKTQATVVSNSLETTASYSQGVVLECFQAGGKLRMRVLSPGYHNDWMVQFPKNIREEGARYWVAEIRESAQGGFYRAYGDIKRIV
ncbi:MAG: WGR domain-containing protein [Synechococcales cyanobacterium]